MAIALRTTSPSPPRGVLRPALVLLAALILALGVALSGGFRLPEPGTTAAIGHAAGAGAPVYDNRGKWTGY